MQVAELQRKLLTAARVNPPADRVPHTFEKRIMALLQTRRVLDWRELWARALWRAAVVCLMLTLLLGALTLAVPTKGSPGNLSQAFETTMLAGLTQTGD